MKRISAAIIAATTALCLTIPTAAYASPSITDDDATNQAMIEQADSMPVEADPKAQKSKGIQITPKMLDGGGGSSYYTPRKGVIYVTTDGPLGHAAIAYNTYSVIEAVDVGVVKRTSRWDLDKDDFYVVTVIQTSNAQDVTAANWAYRQLGKPYNFNYANPYTRSRFYCSQLVWAAFKDNFKINLDTSAWGIMIKPVELMNNGKVKKLYEFHR